MCRSLFRYLCCFQTKESKSTCNYSEVHAVSVVIASFLINMVVEGSYNVWNVAYTTFADEFKESRFLTAWAGSVLQSTPSMFGPFASIIIHKFGCRKSTIAGACIAFSGWFIGSYSKNIYFLAFTYGLIGGFGLSLAYIPSLFIVAFYYQKRLSLASSIAVAGSGVGVFVYAPLTDLLIRHVQWRGAVVIFACFFLQMVPCGLLFVMPKSDLDETSKSNETVDQPQINIPPNATSKSELPGSLSIPIGSIRSSRHSSQKALIDIRRRSDEERAKTSFAIVKNKKNLDDRPESVSTVEINASKTSGKDASVSKKSKKKKRTNRVEAKTSRSFSDKSITASIPSDTAVMMIKHKFVGQDVAARIVQMPTIKEDEQSIHDKKSVRETNNCLNFSILKNRMFVLFCLQSFLVFLAYDTPLMNMPGLAVSKGISSREAAMLLSIFGIFTTIGQIGLGWIADFKYFNNISLYSVTTIIAGLSTVMVANANTYIALASYCAIYGIFISANFALSTVIIVDNLGKEALNDAFGICSMAEGLAILVGPPVGGYFHDITGNYKLTFVVAGLTITVSTFVFYIDNLFCLLFRRHCGRPLETSSENPIG